MSRTSEANPTHFFLSEANVLVSEGATEAFVLHFWGEVGHPFRASDPRGIRRSMTIQLLVSCGICTYMYYRHVTSIYEAAYDANNIG